MTLETQLVVLRPDDVDLLKQLVGNDLVHDEGADTLPRLIKYRIGSEGHQKQAFALINPETREVYAAIYGCLVSSPIGNEGDIPGKVSELLDAPSAPLEGKPTAIIFYSVSALFKDGTRELRLRDSGKILIDKLMDYADQGGLPEGIIRSTLSPLRDLVKTYPFLAHKIMRVGNVLPYMCALHHVLWGDYYVARSHLRRGAGIGDIKCNANHPGSKDDIQGAGIMVNFVYPEQEMQRTKNGYAFDKARSGDGYKGELLSGYLRHKIGLNQLVFLCAWMKRRMSRMRYEMPTPSPQS